MNNLQIFEHPKFGRIRTIVEEGKTLFCGKDAADSLMYKEPHKAIARHCPHGVKRPVGVQTGTKADGTPAIQQVEMVFITDGDLCRLAAKSELPGANEFESWIFDEVIPSILRTGSYMVPAQAPAATFVAFPEGVSISGLASLIRITRRAILDAGGTPQDVCSMIRETFTAVNFPVPSCLKGQIPGQTSFFELKCLGQKSA